MALMISRARRAAALAASLALPAHASARAPDAPPSFLAVRASVPAGGVAHVTDVRGSTISGVLGNVTAEAVEVIVRGEARAVPARDVQRIRWQQPDSWVSGALIGAGIGAIPGVYYLMTDPNECVGLCPEEYAFVGLGALVGALVDRAITRKVTVYDRAAKEAAPDLRVTSVLTGARQSVHVTVRF